MTITQKEIKKSRDLVEKLLKVNGEKYNDWLHQHHQQFIEDNQDLILEALSSFTEINKNEKEQKTVVNIDEKELNTKLS